MSALGRVKRTAALAYPPALLNASRCAGAGPSRVAATVLPYSGTTLGRRLWALRRGFSPYETVLDQLDEKNVRDYLPSEPYRAGHPYNGFFSRLIDNKAFLTYSLGRWPDRIPTYHCLILSDGIVPLPHSNNGEPPPLTLTGIVDRCQRDGSLVLKPYFGQGGRGVLRLSVHGERWMVNGREASQEGVLDLLSGLRDYLVMECIEQDAWEESVFPEALNTLRILTARDLDTGRAFIVRAVHRFGTAASQPVDNWCRGGVCCLVDAGDGLMRRAVQKTPFRWVDAHPDTGVLIAGERVPHWATVRESILEMANALGFFSLMGWDVAITREGLKVLEINSLSDVDLLQVYAPLLDDVRTRRFFAARGVGLESRPAH